MTVVSEWFRCPSLEAACGFYLIRYRQYVAAVFSVIELGGGRSTVHCCPGNPDVDDARPPALAVFFSSRAEPSRRLASGSFGVASFV